MNPLSFMLAVTFLSFGAGLLGSLVGVGGGIVVVPFLTLFFGVDIHQAIAASIISVIATSSGAAASYVRTFVANLRVAMFLEVATAAGAVSGALLAAVISGRWLFIFFGSVLLYTAVAMFRHSENATHCRLQDAWADRLGLHSDFFDSSLRQFVVYRVHRSKAGFCLSYLAGVVSGLLGVGGGIIKVPVMNLAMGMPLKACTATSNLMIGVTAVASAAAYFCRGDVQPFLAAPVAVGVLLGALAGSKLMDRLGSRLIRSIFVAVLVIASVQMLFKGLTDVH